MKKLILILILALAPIIPTLSGCDNNPVDSKNETTETTWKIRAGLILKPSKDTTVYGTSVEEYNGVYLIKDGESEVFSTTPDSVLYRNYNLVLQ